MGAAAAAARGAVRAAHSHLEDLAGSPLRPEKKRIRSLYQHRPPRAAVVCFDEWGPLELKPIGGVAWARRRRPARMRATYRRLKGTEQFLGFYDVHADCLSGLFSKRKRVRDLIAAFRKLRACYPRTRLFVILDNLHNVHDHPRFLSELKRLRVHPVWTPTEASWLNLIEPQFGLLKRFTLMNTDDSEHIQRRRRIYAYLRYRNRKASASVHPLTRLRSATLNKLERH